MEVEPGQALCIPRGAHGFTNYDAVDAKTLTTMGQAVIGSEFFREMAAVIDAVEGSPPSA